MGRELERQRDLCTGMPAGVADGGGFDFVVVGGGVASWFPDTLFIESLGIFILCWLTCWFLHRHKIYLKI